MENTITEEEREQMEAIQWCLKNIELTVRDAELLFGGSK